MVNQTYLYATCIFRWLVLGPGSRRHTHAVARHAPHVRMRLLHGTRLLGAPARPFPSEATLQIVLAKVLEGHPGAAAQSLEAFPDANEKPTNRSEFQPEEFGDITVGELAEQLLGLFWWLTVGWRLVGGWLAGTRYV